MNQINSCDWLLVDASNILYSSFYANKEGDADVIAGLALHQVLVRLQKFFTKFKPRKGIVMAFDQPNWRKVYTESDQCKLGLVYKGHRRQNMTPSERNRYERFMTHVAACEKFIQENTTVFFLREFMLEGDDLIAGFIQHRDSPDEEVIILSADSDFHQLLKHPNVYQYNPTKGAFVDLSAYHDSPEFYLFQKIVRGDLQTDNIPSAYPRIRSTALWDAFNDPYKMTNLINSTWVDVNGNTVLVKDRMYENRLLIDLGGQPEPIRELIKDTVEAEKQRKATFSLFNTMKFVGAYQLVEIQKNIDTYIPMLSKPRSPRLI